MIWLYCAIVGKTGGVFGVKINKGDQVWELKKKIKDENQATITCDANELQLFLAKKDGVWLPDDDLVAVDLENGTIHPDIDKMMNAEQQMQDNKTLQFWLFEENKMPKPYTDQIHVLVVVPKQDGTLNETSVAQTPLQDEEASAYSFSKLNSAMRDQIVRKMRLVENVPDVKEPEDTSIGGYSWIPKIEENEESQRAGYMAYLQQHLKTLIDRGDFLLDDIADDKSVLDIVDPRLPFAMRGTADVLLINRTSKNPLIKLAGVSLVIELKKKVEPDHVPQAIGQLVSCSMKAPLNCYPLSLLTDLNDRWHFSWFSDNHILTQVTLKYPKNAFRLIEAAVLRRTESASLPPSFIPGPFKIIKVDEFLLQPDDGYAEEMMERYELMADVVEPEFLMARRAEYAQHLVQSMPMYAHTFK
uniref:Crinkling and necrosis inducing protein 8 n=1 Tax=Phytophthora capsici TaxID=4784 RepID=A0A1L1UKL4_PHYCP|nr:crinkling and necrosis inducing protein 8 [Phytophthora capsici]